MSIHSWQINYAAKTVSAKQALANIQNGQTIYLGSGPGEPLVFTETLAEIAGDFWDVEVLHLTATQQEFILARPEMKSHFRYNTLYIGQGVTDALAEGIADYTPMNISELPYAMRRGIINVDVALVQVSPPDALGLCSLGVSVDATKAAVESADLVIAQVNKYMPVTFGDSLIPVEDIDLMVECDRPLTEVPPPEIDAISLTIGRHIASLIRDGMTLHFDRGSISAAAMRYLDTKKDLGIHTGFLTDDILRLIKSRAVTNREKNINKGKTVATMVVGSQELYKEVDGNPYIELLPIDQVNHPFIISKNDNMVSIQTVSEMELTGAARIFSEGDFRIGSLTAGRDFINGARRSKNGFTIMALHATTPDGRKSRIVATSAGHGTTYSRTKVDFVVTEYGIANLYGLTSRERAVALISIAHPRFRHQLLKDAIEAGYVGKDQIMPPENGCVYPSKYEFTHVFKGGLEVFFRPVKPSDAYNLQRLFYQLSPEARRLRYHGTIKKLSIETAQSMAAVDYSQDMAIVGLVGHGRSAKIIAEGRYLYNSANNMGEFDIVVHEKYQQQGIGKFLGNYLKKIAYANGLDGIYAEVIQRNEATIALLNKAWPTAVRSFNSGGCTFALKFPKEDVENPKDSILIYSGRFGDFSYGRNHPFNPGRAVAMFQLLRDQGYLDEPWMRVEEPRPIAKERLIESHDPQFIQALQSTDAGVWQEEFLKFNLGKEECPIFPHLFDYVLLYTSATITGTDLIIEENANVVFNPLGGFHHASRSAAEGFCYVNDAIVAIDIFLARGFKVAYIDLDAHHGNGVQDAYYADDRVLTISLHESGKTLFPWCGFENEIGEDIGKGYNVNVPMPEGTDDESFEMVMDRVVAPAVNRFVPNVVVAVVGADTHRSDPLAHLSLTNNGMVNAVKKLREFGHHLLLLGGGGYDLQATIRAWSRMWAAANRIDALPDYLLVLGGAFMGGEGVLGADIIDPVYRTSGDQKAQLERELERIAEYHEANTLPLIGRKKSIVP
ncbi:MAG: GNAT family N-acetyltransferase [Myxococcota bacterium]|nr:GNAT family N-acetyltransferase [Myxococcota bacterium]